MMDAFAETPDEDLERRVRGQLTPDILEWLKRQKQAMPTGQRAPSSAEFNFSQGGRAGAESIIRAVTKLLTEANDPEKHFHGSS